jgi:hypothetical protein
MTYVTRRIGFASGGGSFVASSPRSVAPSGGCARDPSRRKPMSERIAPVAALLLACALPMRTACAQGGNDGAAYVALLSTPQGALVPAVLGSRVDGPMSLALRYGRLQVRRSAPIHHGGFTLDFSRGPRARGAVTLGGIFCSGCTPIVNVAFDYERVLAASVQQGGRELTVSLKPSIGYARPTGGARFNLASATVGLPVALRMPVTGSDLSVMPYLVPAIGIGTIFGDIGGSDIGYRPMLGGGLRFDWAERNTGVLVGFQKVLIEHGVTVLGAGLTLNAGRAM